MDKLENESWDEYAFRNELFIINYVDKEKQIIEDIRYPNPDKLFFKNKYINLNFERLTRDLIFEIKEKYKMNGHDCSVDCGGFSAAALKRLSKEDYERQQILFSQKRFWDRKGKDIVDYNRLKSYNRWNELIKIISETHKEQLEELLSMVDIMEIPSPPENTKEYKEFKEYQQKKNEKKDKLKKERIDLYHKYMKNKEVRLQIIELEQKISNLKSELIK